MSLPCNLPFFIPHHPGAYPQRQMANDIWEMANAVEYAASFMSSCIEAIGRLFDALRSRLDLKLARIIHEGL
jgi:hypothetical protein